MSNFNVLPVTLGGGGLADIPDPLDVITSMQNQPGFFSSEVYQTLVFDDPFHDYLSKTKKFFAEGMGDTDTTLVFDVSAPSERDVLNWQVIKEASPGYNPSAFNVTREIDYGHRKVSACLYKDAIRTKPFSKWDLTFKPKREMQMAQHRQIMSNYARQLWIHWATASFSRTVRCQVLNSAYGHGASAVGGYPVGILPDSHLTYNYLEALKPGVVSTSHGSITAEAKPMADSIGNKQMIFLGNDMFNAFMDELHQRSRTKYGTSPDNIVIPGLGDAKNLGNYMFVIVTYPRRFRLPVGGESWEDCIIPHRIKVASNGGAEVGSIDRENPDYRNPAIAKVEEIRWPNLDSVEWLVPPQAMVKSMSNGKVEMFPASDYSGNFFPVNFKSDNDPTGENCYFLARFASGMKGVFPERSRAILAVAAHPRVQPFIQDGQALPAGQNDSLRYPINGCGGNAVGRLSVLIAGTLPADGSTPDGKSLFIVSESGKKYIIGTIHANGAFAGDHQRAAGRMLEISLPSSLSAAQTCRPQCDPWSHLAWLAADTPSDAGEPCALCGDGATGDADANCTLLAMFYTDSVTDVVNGSAASIVTGEPFTTAAGLQTALNTYLTANGGGTAVVSLGSDFLWTVTITADSDGGAGITALRAGKITFSDGVGTNDVSFTAENCA